MSNGNVPFPVDWIKNSNNGQYFDFLKLNLDAPYFLNKTGVYVIWYVTPTGGKAIYVGQGNIGERLKAHRNNWKITQYSRYGQLKVTWALVEGEYLDNIEAGLYRDYAPLEVERVPSALPISVTPI
jgi:hypothetical protein